MLSMDIAFSRDYVHARRKFLAAAHLRGLQVTSHEHPLLGAQGEALFTDVVRIGPQQAARVLVLTSGVHGLELFAGSGCQIEWLLQHSADALPADTAVVVVHAINPWGASHLRRYTEDNVDLCRNYVDHAQLPVSAKYPQLHASIDVDPEDAQQVTRADAGLAAYANEHGHDALYTALMGGQYAFPLGMGFGGTTATWSRQTMEALLREQCAGARHVCMIDYHTGLGPYSYGSMVALQRGPSLQRIREIFGEWVVAVYDEAKSQDFEPVTGHTTPGYELVLPDACVTPAVLEYGTSRPQRMLELLVRDQRDWCFGQGLAGNRITETRRELLEFFYPDDAHWRRALADQSNRFVARALGFLAQSA
jgi:hypothetical protein